MYVYIYIYIYVFIYYQRPTRKGQLPVFPAQWRRRPSATTSSTKYVCHTPGTQITHKKRHITPYGARTPFYVEFLRVRVANTIANTATSRSVGGPFHLRVVVLHPGITPLRNGPKWCSITRCYPGHMPKWGHFPGVIPGRNTKAFRIPKDGRSLVCNLRPPSAPAPAAPPGARPAAASCGGRWPVGTLRALDPSKSVGVVFLFGGGKMASSMLVDQQSSEFQLIRKACSHTGAGAGGC